MTAFFCSSVSVADVTPASDIVPCSADVSNSESSTHCVGQTAQGCPPECRADGTKVPLSERELDLHILDLARLVKKAQDDGDPTGARLWSRDLADAINSRSTAHQRRLNDEAWERMNQGAAYFSYQGELARQRIEQERGAA